MTHAADYFKKCRLRLKLSQADLGRSLGVTATTVARWERGFARIPKRAWAAVESWPYPDGLVFWLRPLTAVAGRRGKRLRSLRESSGLSLRECARRIGVSHEAWNAWERGRSMPPAEAFALVGAEPIGRRLRHPSTRQHRVGAPIKPRNLDELNRQHKRAAVVLRAKIQALVSERPGLTNAAYGAMIGVSHMTVLRHRRAA